jgi:hypothetical protein
MLSDASSGLLQGSIFRLLLVFFLLSTRKNAIIAIRIAKPPMAPPIAPPAPEESPPDESSDFFVEDGSDAPTGRVLVASKAVSVADAEAVVDICKLSVSWAHLCSDLALTEVELVKNSGSSMGEIELNDQR